MIIQLVRSSVYYCTTILRHDFVSSKSELGWLDLSLLLPYASIQIAFSSAWDRSVPRPVIAACMALTSVAMLLFGATHSLLPVCLCLLVSGAAQAPLWPNITKVLSSWHPEDRLSSVFGVISTAPYVGALAGTALAIYIQDRLGWRYVFLPAGVAGVLVGLAVLVFLQMPKDVNMEIPGVIQKNPSGKTAAAAAETSSFGQLWSIPGVPELTAGVFCLKFVRYCMYMWLPLYLIEHLGYSKTHGGLFSTLFDIGGIAGGPVLGIYVDKLYSDKPLWGIYQLMMIGTATFILVALIASWGVGYCSVLLIMAGASNCGPDSLLTGSVPMMIGEKYGRHNGAAVTSLVNGVGSVGAIVEGPIIGLVSQHVGWLGVMGCMIVLTFFATLSILKAFLILRIEDKRLAKASSEESSAAPLVQV